MSKAQIRSVSEVPTCLLCNAPTRLLYPSNAPSGEAICSGEVACTSPYLSVHDDIFYCRSCGLARSVPPVDEDDLANLCRQVEDPDYLISEAERRASFREALEEMGRYHPPGRLLEVGSAAGLFLEEARRRGWDAVGLGPGPSAWIECPYGNSRQLRLGRPVVRRRVALGRHGTFDGSGGRFAQDR